MNEISKMLEQASDSIRQKQASDIIRQTTPDVGTQQRHQGIRSLLEIIQLQQKQIDSLYTLFNILNDHFNKQIELIVDHIAPKKEKTEGLKNLHREAEVPDWEA